MEASGAQSQASGGPAPELEASSLYEAFVATVERLGDAVALRSGESAQSWNELASQVGRIAGGLASLGVGKGDTVALMLANRPEFVACDLAAVALGAVPFSIYQTSSPEQIAYVVGDAEARVAVVEAAFLDAFEEARAELPELEHVIVLDGEGGSETLAELEARDPGFDPSATGGAVGPDDLLTLIYTSGTTGPPKGVQLTHRNLLTLVASVDDLVPFPEEGGCVISWLPAAHIAERGANYYLPVVKGLEIQICPDPREIVQFLPRARPTWFFAVPRVWEKLKAGPRGDARRAAGGAAGAGRARLRRGAGEGAARAARRAGAGGDRRGGGERRRGDVRRPARSSSASTARSRSASARRRPRSRCSSSSTRSASRSASSGGCRRPAASPPATRRSGSSWARSARRSPGSS